MTTKLNRMLDSAACLAAAITIFVTLNAAWADVDDDSAAGDGLSIESDIQYAIRAAAIANTKIWGGVKVAPGAFANVVGLTRRGTKQIKCTGTLIEKDVVVTAAHCICSSVSATAVFGDKEGAATVSRVQNTRQALNRCGSDLTDGLDVGVLLLARESNVPPVAIQDDRVVDRAESYHIVGFGGYDRTTTGQLIAGEKRETVVPTATNDCTGTVTNTTRSYSSAFGCAAGHEIVAGSAGLGRDTCNGDSGGPLLVTAAGTGASSGGQGTGLSIAGVTSRATKSATVPCGDGGIYVRLNSDARKWIAQAIQQMRNENSR